MITRRFGYHRKIGRHFLQMEGGWKTMLGRAHLDFGMSKRYSPPQFNGLLQLLTLGASLSNAKLNAWSSAIMC